MVSRAHIMCKSGLDPIDCKSSYYSGVIELSSLLWIMNNRKEISTYSSISRIKIYASSQEDHQDLNSRLGGWKDAVCKCDGMNSL